MIATHKPAPANSHASRENKGGHQPFFEATKVRTKLTVNEPGDRFEQQADRVADDVVRGTKPTDQISRKPAFESDAEPERPLQRAAPTAAPEVSSHTQQQIEPSKGRGQSLAPDTRQQMESAMGADLSDVKIHEGAEASAMNRELNAQAFTY